MLSDYLKFLGTRQRDKVSGHAGVVTSVSFDINGCIQAAIQPPLDKDGKWVASIWFDLDRLEVCGDAVMEPYAYEKPRLSIAGPADKPAK